MLITNSYTWYNKGDAAIVLGMARAIREHLPSAEITVLSFTPKLDEAHYTQWDIQTLTNVLNPYPMKGGKLSTIVLTAPELGARFVAGLVGRELPFRSAVRDTLEAYKHADIVVGCGGAYLGGGKYQSLGHLYGLWLGKRFNKPVVLYAHSVVPFRSASLRLVTTYVLGRLDLVMCRERTTYDYLRSIGTRTPLAVVPDPAFLLTPIPSEHASAMLRAFKIGLEDRPLIGMTVRNWGFPGIKQKDIKLREYKDSIAQLAKYVVNEQRGRVVLFPQVTYGPVDDDRMISNEIWASLPETVKTRVHVITAELEPSELKGMIGCMDFFVGTRMHSNIFALGQRVPCIGIAYEPKTRGIMETLGLAGQVVEIDNVGEGMLLDMYRRLFLSKEAMKEQINASVNVIEQEARTGGAFIAELLQTRNQRQKRTGL